MRQVRHRGGSAGLLVAVILTGCQQPAMNMADMMKPTPRAAELDRLEPMIGTWEGTAEMKIAGMDKPMTSKGTSVTSWELDRRFMVERYTAEMNDGSKMSGTSYWTWDSKDKIYRTWWFDNFGATGEGTVRYDEGARTWHMKSESRSPGGDETHGEGTIKMADNNTIEWNYSEWDEWKLNRCAEMKGTSKRK